MARRKNCISATQPAVYTLIGENDVILGRGKTSYNNPGNVSFRKLVQDRALAYKQKNKAHRRALAQVIIRTVQRRGGKFLRPMEPPSGEEPSQWQDVPASMAVTKVKQALRDVSSRIADDRQPKTLLTAASAPTEQNPLAATSNLLPSTLPRMNPPSVILPSSHSQLPPTAPSHPLLANQPTDQDSEYYFLLGQLATLEQRVQQREETERMLQQLQVLDQQLPALLSSGLTLPPQQGALLHRLNSYASIPNQQTPTSTQDVIRELNNLRNLAPLDPGLLLQATLQPPHQRDRSVLALDPLLHELGTAALTTRNHGGIGMNTSISNLTDQRVSLGSYFPPPVWRGDDNIFASGGLAPIPTSTAGTMQNVMAPNYRDDLELPLLDEHAGGVGPLSHNGPHCDDNTLVKLAVDHHLNNESASQTDDLFGSGYGCA